MKFQEINRLFCIIRTFLFYGIENIFTKKHHYIFIIILKYVFFCHFSRRTLSFKIKLALEKLGPVWIKFGQMLSTRLDLFPNYIIKQLSDLQDKVTPVNKDTIINQIEKSLKSSIKKYFYKFNFIPLASASISQVHTAFLKENNKEVVIKVLRPNISILIKKDIKLMYFISNILNFFFIKFRRFRFLEVIANYEKDLNNEINLLNEVKNTKKLRNNFLKSKILYFPKIYEKYCSNSIIVMEKIYGIPISNISELKKHNIDMHLLAQRGVQIFFTQVFRDSFFHADMHPGNIFINYKDPKDPQYIGIDCGIVGVLNKEDKYYLAANFIAFFNRDYRKIAELHIDSGWVSPDTNISDLELAIFNVCEPIFQKPLSDISFGDILIKLFRTAKKFNMEIQPQLILLQKTLFYIEGIGRQLYPKLDLWKTAKPFLEKWIKKQNNIFYLINIFNKNIPSILHNLPQIPDILIQNIRFLKNFKYYIYQLSNNIKYNKQKKNVYINVLILFISISSSYLLYNNKNYFFAFISIINIFILMFNVIKK